MELKLVMESVLEAIVEWNQQADAEHQLVVSPATPLLGKASKLDSFGLVNLIVLVEEKINDQFGRTITLADERAMSQERSPFRSVESLTDYAYLLLTEKENG